MEEGPHRHQVFKLFFGSPEVVDVKSFLSLSNLQRPNGYEKIMRLRPTTLKLYPLIR